MTTTSDPDEPFAPADETDRWRPNERPLVEPTSGMTAARVAARRAAVGALALGAMAVGAVAIGALAIGALRIGRLGVRRAHLGKVEIDDLVVRRLRVLDLD
jgi:hypothetical protein